MNYTKRFNMAREPALSFWEDDGGGFNAASERRPAWSNVIEPPLCGLS